MIGDILAVTWSAAYLVFMWTYAASVFSISFHRKGRLTEIFGELYPFVPYALVIDLAINQWGRSVTDGWWDYALKAFALAGWLFLKPPDDRWKRRRRRAVGAVRSLGHRLVVAR